MYQGVPIGHIQNTKMKVKAVQILGNKTKFSKLSSVSRHTRIQIYKAPTHQMTAEHGP
jgi:hypothetical protein